jgi:hypothetical protein
MMRPQGQDSRMSLWHGQIAARYRHAARHNGATRQAASVFLLMGRGTLFSWWWVWEEAGHTASAIDKAQPRPQIKAVGQPILRR